MTYTNSFFGISDNDTRFNLIAAVDAYEWVLANPDTCRFVLSKALFDHVPRDIEYHRPVVDAAVDGFVKETVAKAKTGISRSYISKRDSGGDATAAEVAVYAIETISKAFYTEQERRANTERQIRDSRGRFVVMNRKVNPRLISETLEGDVRERAEIPDATLVDAERRRKFQNDYVQVARMLNDAVEKENADPNKSWVETTYSSGTKTILPLGIAREDMNDPSSSTNGPVSEDNYLSRADALGSVKSVKVTTEAPEGSAGPSFDVLSGMSNPRFADYVIRGGRDLSSDAGREFEAEWNKNGDRDAYTNEQFWRRMSAASDLASTLAAPLSPEAALALKAGAWAGQLAPEAEKVIGPAARKSAYRYRGTEKKPDPIYQRTINNLRRSAMSSNDPAPGRRAHDVMLKGENHGTVNYKPSPVIAKLESLLPDPKRYHLNRMSGTIPPSQGILIDRKGNVVSEAIGYGEDWYLPFNLKNLSKLDGGEYIRTRAFGGPTTEDIYAGLTTNARAVTVVSHSGVFTIEFDDSFRGGRRFNDKAARMQDRYGKLLDAIKSKQVTLGTVPPDRLEEIKDEASDTTKGGYDPYRTPAEYKQRVKEILAREKDAPKLSEHRLDQIRLSVLNDYVTSNTDFRTYDDFLSDLSRKNPQKYEDFSISTSNAVENLGLTRQYEAERKNALAVYQQEMKPLDINGPGYHQALLALQEQFPYYIRSIHYTEGKGGRDYGYVKPNYNRPEGAYESYFDATITGKGKISADQTNYQNWPRRQSVEVSVRPNNFTIEEEEIGLPSGSNRNNGAARQTPNAAPRAAAKVDDLVARLQYLRGQQRFARSIAGDNAPLAGKAIDDDYRRQLAMNFGWGNLFLEDAADLDERLYNEGPDGPLYNRVKEDLDAAFASGFFDPYTETLESNGEAKQAVPQNVQALLGAYRGIEQGRRYVFSDLSDGQDRNYYNARIADFLVSAPGLRAANIRPDLDDTQIMNAIHAHATTLANAQRAYNRGVIPAGSPKESEIAREAMAMAKIAQAVQMRKSAPAAPTPAAPTGSLGRSGPFPSAPSEGAAPVARPAQSAPSVPQPRRENRIDAIRSKIRGMAGMETVSSEIDSLINSAKVAAKRKEMGKPVPNSTKHLVFTGNPGVGKTMIAKELAPIYYELGLVPNDTFIAPPRSELVSDHVGGTSKAIDKLFEENHGGVIFIDEAYALKTGERDLFGKEAVTAILVNADKYRDDTVVILAGYPRQMSEFLQSDPGLESRFPKKINFPDYDAKALNQIAGQMITENDYSFDRGAQAMLRNAASQIASNPEHSNARDVRNLVDATFEAQADRLAGSEAADSDYDVITVGDVRAAMVKRGLTPVMKAPRKKAA